MLPTRFLSPWDLLNIDLHDMKHESEDGDKFMLVVVGEASKFILSYPLSSKVLEPVASNLPTLCLTFGGTA